MGHTPFGYKIDNGIAVIDQPAADKLRQLYKNYLSGMSLSKAASAAGIKTYHGTAKRLMETAHYLGDSFYPAIIDKDTYQKAQEERKRRATALGRNNKQTQMRKLQIPTHFHMGEVTVLYDNPVKQAEYLSCKATSRKQRQKAGRRKAKAPSRSVLPCQYRQR